MQFVKRVTKISANYVCAITRGHNVRGTLIYISIHVRLLVLCIPNLNLYFPKTKTKTKQKQNKKQQQQQQQQQNIFGKSIHNKRYEILPCSARLR